jgi:multicomponent Na+:H+ antiporter subunit E
MSYVIQFILSYLFWVLLVWPFDFASGKLLASGGGADLIAGLAVAAMAAAVFGRMFPRNAGKLFSPLRYLFFACYLLIAVWALLAGCVDVAYRSLHLRVPVRPSIVKVRTSIRSEMGRMLLANSISLAPGTLVVDIVGQDLYVHWSNTLTDSPEIRRELLVGRFEDVLKRVFD